MTVLSGARVVTPHGVLDPGWVRVRSGRIVEVGGGDWPDAGAGLGNEEVIDLDGQWLLPGFIDLHVHGGGGHDFTASPQDIAAGVAFHQSRGTTRTMVSLMAGPLDAMCEQVGWISVLAGDRDSRVIGAHIEGPFLAHARCGAQNPGYLLSPDRQVLAKLLEAGQGNVRIVTLAPELPGALELIPDVAQAGAIAAIGHTDADYAQAMAGFQAGALIATHLFNAMPGLRHRDPGPVAAAFDSGAACEIVNDGWHIDPAITRLVARVDPAQLVLITDAISATGVGDGQYRLGDQPVEVIDGVARLADSSRLAGSTLTMDEAVRRAVLEVGLSIEVAAAGASTNPARVLGLSQRCGAIADGLDADLVVLDAGLEVVKVMIGGVFV